MKKKKIYLFFMCFSLFFIAACQKNAALKTPLCRVVTAVEIRGKEKNVSFSRRYTNEEKMGWVLIYLRTLNADLRPQILPENPPINTTEILLKFSDGKEKIYHQTAHKFISENYQFHYAIDPAKAAELYRLIRLLPSDSL